MPVNRCEEIAITLDPACMILTLAAPAVSVVYVPDIVPTERLRDLARPLRRGWRHQHMDMISHQHIGVNGESVFSSGFAQAC